jgi:translocation and assembly module TamA
VRIFTPIGPARLDLAFPLNRRPEIDDKMIFYISLGQAF